MDKNKIIQECLTQFREVYPSVTVPPITWNGRMRTSGGRVRSQRSERRCIALELNPNVLIDEARLYKTLMHELAHVAEIVLYGNGGHGHTWQICMQKLGQRAERCHTYDVEHLARRQSRIEAKCSCMTHMISKQRANKMRRGQASYKCKKCATSIKLS